MTQFEQIQAQFADLLSKASTTMKHSNPSAADWLELSSIFEEMSRVAALMASVRAEL